MTTIKTTCQCGDVELNVDEVRLELEPSEETGIYLFDCPHCGERVRRPANERVVSVLLASGVAFKVVRPNPLTEAEAREWIAALATVRDIAELEMT